MQNYVNTYTCTQCPSDYYLFLMPNTSVPGQCNKCPPTDIQCKGGAQVYVDPKYWRDSVISIDVYPCDPILSNCLGGTDEDICGVGYIGPLCKECNNPSNYARDVY